MRWVGLGAAALLACAPAAERAEAPLIYGVDDRLEAYETSSEVLRAIAIDAAPVLVGTWQIVDEGGGTISLDASSNGDRHGLCADEAFVDQPSAGFCSATLIDDDLVLTAGHCVEGVPCEETAVVFGFHYDAADSLHPISREDDVFGCAAIVVGGVSADADYAVIQLDRPARAHTPIALRMTDVAVGEDLSLVGHPHGLPVKVVEHGTVSRWVGARFQARLDSMPGSSGSGVFDAEGFLVGELYAAPDEALVEDGDCFRLHVVPPGSTDSQYVTAAPLILRGLCGSGYPSERLCRRSPACGDAFCTDGETLATCAADCAICGDGTCAEGERCPFDCAPDAGTTPPPRASGCSAGAPRGGAIAALLLLALSTRHARGAPRARSPSTS